MTRYHISEDGKPRVCKAQSPESCTAKGVDGQSAVHGEFSDPSEAQSFAESVVERSLESDGLESQSRSSLDASSSSAEGPAAQSLKSRAEGLRARVVSYLKTKAEDLRSAVADYRNPKATKEERQSIQEGWKSQGIPNQFSAMLRASEYDRRASGASLEDRSLKSTDGGEYRIENGDIRAKLDGKDYNLGQLSEYTESEVKVLSEEAAGESVALEDGEAFTSYEEYGPGSASFIRIGDKYYGAYASNIEAEVPDQRMSSFEGESSQFFVHDGGLEARYGRETHQFGKLVEIPKERFEGWAQSYLGEDSSGFKDGDVVIDAQELGDRPVAYAQIGDRYYRAR